MKFGASIRPRSPALLLAALALGGCARDVPHSTLQARSDLAREILGLYALITWAAIGIATVVCVVLAWVLLRYRGRPGAPVPRQTRGHTALEIGWTLAPALVLLVIAVPTIQVVFRTQGAATPGALEVVVRGWQWWWEFRYPELGVVTANELHLPAGRPAVLRLEGTDVIHSFWVPQLGGKRDVIPGRTNQITLTPDTPGVYPGQCAEFCGASHANMRMLVVVHPPGDFERWVVGQRAPAREPAGEAAAGKAVYTRSACVGCHTIRGVSAGVVGPDLTHFGSRRTVGAGLLPATLDNVAAWVRDPEAIKPGVKMPALGLTEAEARALAAYLLSLE
ncbi:MAG: cytochrome c oxidase subunit II [Candidatus Rokubacteria bacterium]|nr:cytochrome c oxidase subunit II [Candidatus Rokubacteria bacterium]